MFVKIRVAFRPGVVDLPQQAKKSRGSVLTIPDLFNDFEKAVTDMK